MLSSTPNAPAPLAGVRVLDLSRLLPGPFATLLLSDLGAEVIRVEDPSGSDYVRHLPPLCDDGMGVLFHALNRGKKSITLDLKSDEGKQRLFRLAAQSDVLVESFRPGVLKKLGPRLIVCSLSGYGQNSSMSTRAGHDLNFVARAGVLGGVQNPAPLTLPLADIAGGSWPTALQILAALLQRAQTQKGCWIDVPIATLTTSLMILEWVKALCPHSPDTAISDPLSGTQPCYGVYATQDGHLAVAALEYKFWKSLVVAMGLPHLIDHALVDASEAIAIKHELQHTFSQKTTREWLDLLDPLDVCVEPIFDIAKQADEHGLHHELGLIKALPINQTHTLLPCVVLDASLAQSRMQPAPQLGENNAEFP
jgi:alpha-methylacyl-CoA racemase